MPCVVTFSVFLFLLSRSSVVCAMPNTDQEHSQNASIFLIVFFPFRSYSDCHRQEHQFYCFGARLLGQTRRRRDPASSGRATASKRRGRPRRAVCTSTSSPRKRART